MIPPQVNRVGARAALVISLACTASGTAKQATETTTATRSETASITARPAQTDSIITRADLARIQGSATAPLWVIEVSDFQCPFCKQWHDNTYAALRDQYVKTGKVRLAYVNFPLSSHAHAWPAAESAMCAGAQARFWPMHDGLFATQTRWQGLSSPMAMVVFDSLAQANGLDMQSWRNCVTSGKMKPLIEADHDRALRAGASVTPSFMIGNKILPGAQPFPVLQRVIDSALVNGKRTAP